MSIDRTAASWVAGENPAGTKLQTEIKGLWDGLQAAWDVFAPSWTAVTTNPTIGNGSLSGRWIVIGQTVHFAVIITIGSTTTLGTGIYTFGIPATAISSQRLSGITGFTTPSVNLPLAFRGTTSTGLRAMLTTTGAALASTSGLASGDRIEYAGTYEAA